LSKSELELSLYLQLEDLVPKREYRFHPVRKWKCDFAFIKQKLLVEVEGGIFTGGRHVTGTGYVKDLIKYNQAAILGWTILRYSSKDVYSGAAAKEIRTYLKDYNDKTN
jgi:very-short-patch-repair endonuclease